MIDRKQRDELALALRRFLAGGIDLDGFWRLPPFGWMRDRGVWAIVDELDEWSGDRHNRSVTAESLTAEERATLIRAILFLYGEEEYRWRFVHDFGWLRRLTRAPEGEPKVWPFFRSYELERARANPRLLGGGHSF